MYTQFFSILPQRNVFTFDCQRSNIGLNFFFQIWILQKKKKKLATIKNLLFIIIRKEENVPAANWRRPKSAKNVAKADQRRTTNVWKDPLMFDPLLPRRDHSLSSRISANYSRWIVNRDAASYNGCLRKDGSQDSTIFASFVVKEWQQTTVFPLVSWIKPWRRWMTFRNGRPIHYT